MNHLITVYSFSSIGCVPTKNFFNKSFLEDQNTFFVLLPMKLLVLLAVVVLVVV